MARVFSLREWLKEVPVLHYDFLNRNLPELVRKEVERLLLTETSYFVSGLILVYASGFAHDGLCLMLEYRTWQGKPKQHAYRIGHEGEKFTLTRDPNLDRVVITRNK